MIEDSIIDGSDRIGSDRIGSDRIGSGLLFLGKADDLHCQKALEFLTRYGLNVQAYLGKWGEPLPEEVSWWSGDYIISYLSRWVLPDGLLKKAKKAAINFHPATPDYPGIGCNNFALYEETEEYGVTCHHMSAEVDRGAIITVKRFPVFPEDDVASLLARTHDFLLVLFYEIASQMLRGEPLPTSAETWSRPPFTRQALNALSRIEPDMPREEIARRIRATSYGDFQPEVQVGGYRFRLVTKQSG